MRVLKIVEGTSVDGPGLRTSIYLAGCRHACKGCHNPESWSPRGGREISIDDLVAVIGTNDAPLTLSGGDPLLQAADMEALTERVRHSFGFNIWCYTGYRWEEIVDDPALLSAVRHLDVLVDGPFVLEERDTSLLFRGSRNQRLIDVQRSLADPHAPPVLLNL